MLYETPPTHVVSLNSCYRDDLMPAITEEREAC